jgi:cytochrome c oxidase cbb3-type subunit 3
MSSRCRDVATTGLLLALALGAPACERERRSFASPSQPTVASEAQAREGPFEGNAYGISQGKELYNYFNCVGCHAHGGGGMGPALMDNVWRYGSTPAEIKTSIVEGRPNGMPAFGGRITDDQIWQLVAYVRSLSGLVRADTASGRADHMRVKESEQERADAPPPHRQAGP